MLASDWIASAAVWKVEVSAKYIEAVEHAARVLEGAGEWVQV
jgi:hypothetical protein